jgi:hypothetical protein
MRIPRCHWGIPKDAVGSQFLVLRDRDDHSDKPKTSTQQANHMLKIVRNLMLSPVMAGSLEDFKEAARALFAADRERFDALIAPWPQDIQAHLKRVAQVALTSLEKLTNVELHRA